MILFDTLEHDRRYTSERLRSALDAIRGQLEQAHCTGNLLTKQCCIEEIQRICSRAIYDLGGAA